MKWFKHLSAASEDLFVRQLEERFGDAGYSFWFKTLELIALHGVNGRLEISWKSLQEKMNKKRPAIGRLLSACSVANKLEVTRKKSSVIIKCKKFAEYADNYTKYGGGLQSSFKETSKQEGDVEGEVEVEKALRQKPFETTEAYNLRRIGISDIGKA